jgi:glutamate racemase
LKANVQPIGVFDSGIGGLSILKALRQAMPAERFVYFADSKHNPYGVKSEEFVRERSLSIVQTLIVEHQTKALVVACNTATAAAVTLLRQTYPELPIIGVEPALKPATLATRTGRVLVLATRGTLTSEKFARLKARLEAEHAASGAENQRAVHFTCVPCDGLADRIEQLAVSGQRWQDAPELIDACAAFMPASEHFEHKNERIDTLVLGCTHYPLVRDVFRSLVGEAVTIVDNAEPVALRTMQLLGGKRAPSEQAGGVIWRSSADEAQLLQAARYWGIEQA